MTTHWLYEVDDNGHREDIAEGEPTAEHFTNLRDALAHARERARRLSPENQAYIDRIVVYGDTVTDLVVRALNGRGYVASRERVEICPGTWEGDPCDECGAFTRTLVACYDGTMLCRDCYLDQ